MTDPELSANNISHSFFATQANSGTSITQPHKYNLAMPYVNGEDYMEDLTHHIQELTSGCFLYIADWAMDLNIHLKRKDGLHEDNRLIKILTTAAKKNIQIRVLLWDEAPLQNLRTKDLENETVLESILSNDEQFSNHIRVIRHRPSLSSTHHQKFVVTGNPASNDVVAFLGGLDLTWGRWDSKEHPLVDQDNKLFLGDDYFNPCIYNVDASNINRDIHPRMPWHDVHMKVEGPAARDVESNFVQRWNAHRHKENYTFASDFANVLKFLPNHVPELRRKNTESGEEHEERVFAYTKYRKEDPYVEYDDDEIHERDTTGLYELKEEKLTTSTFAINNKGNQTVQIIRTMHEGTGLGDDKKETSIHEAFIKAIKGAQHYIFIETQYLIGSFSQNSYNQIFEAITDRIIKAHKSNEVFRVYVIFPVQPDSSLDDSSMREFMFWQWQTIHRNRATEYNDEYNEDEPAITLDMEKNNFGGMIGRLKKEMPFDYISNYLNIFNLRQHGKIKSKSDSSDKFVTEQIYVHAKMMIIDDQIAIIGTANLNDRSLLGDLDSEMAAIIIDEDTEISEINGKKCEVRKFARDLRLKLWSEHLGIAPEDMDMITDPVIDATHEYILNTANSNTTAFEMAFPGIPSNNYSTIKSQIDALKTPTRFENQKKHTDIIKGYLVHFPLLWLWQEQGIADSWRPDSFYS